MSFVPTENHWPCNVRRKLRCNSETKQLIIRRLRWRALLLSDGRTNPSVKVKDISNPWYHNLLCNQGNEFSQIVQRLALKTTGTTLGQKDAILIHVNAFRIGTNHMLCHPASLWLACLRLSYFHLWIHSSKPNLGGWWAVAEIIWCHSKHPVHRASVQVLQHKSGCASAKVWNLHSRTLLLRHSLVNGLFVGECYFLHPDLFVVFYPNKDSVTGHNALVMYNFRCPRRFWNKEEVLSIGSPKFWNQI